MKRLMLLSLIATLIFPLTAAAGDDHGKHGAASPQKLELNGDKKWATDGALRQAMGAIRWSALRTLDEVHAGKATDATYDQFAAGVTAQISYIVQNCKLDPKADAQLHLVLADMLDAVETAEGKHADKQRAAGVTRIARALNNYNEHFAHPGWRAISLPH